MKPAVWLGLIVILLSMTFGARAFVTNLTPYVSFDQAREQKGRVQVMGDLDKETISVGAGGTLDFVLVSPEGDRLPVSYHSTRPANFEQATQITAIGAFDGQTFQAGNLLVKCPTKYQGTETQSNDADGSPASATPASALSGMPGAEQAIRQESK